MPRTAGHQNTTRLIIEDDAPSFVGVKRALLLRIGTEWKVEDRLPRISELAQSMHVGLNTVQRAVTELVAEGVLFSRRRLGVFVRRLPDASHGPTGTTALLRGKTIALAMFNEPTVPFVQLMMDGFRQAIAETGADTCVISANDLKQSSPDDSGYWATVLFNPSGDFMAPAGSHNFVVVSTADHLQPDLLSRFDSVSVDQYQGGGLAGRLLREAGCTRLCFVGRRVETDGYRYDMTSSSRLHGLERTWGGHLDSDNLLYVRGYSIHAGGLRFADYLAMSPRPEGVFCASDELALGFVAGAASQNIVPGRDFQLIGFDGQDGQMSAAGGTLTTIRVPAAMMGRRAAELLLHRHADPGRPARRILLPCTISHGDTCSSSIRSS